MTTSDKLTDLFIILLIPFFTYVFKTILKKEIFKIFTEYELKIFSQALVAVVMILLNILKSRHKPHEGHFSRIKSDIEDLKYRITRKAKG